MSEKIIQLNEGIIKDELKELVRSSVEETLNGLLEKDVNDIIKIPNSDRDFSPLLLY